jgi:excisionase family DNA binding protein
VPFDSSPDRPVGRVRANPRGGRVGGALQADDIARPGGVEASALGRGADGARPVIGSYEVPRLLLSTAEVTDALGISERFAKNLVYSGELASLKVGRLRRVYVGDVYAWIERQRGGPLGIVEDRVAPVHRGTG